MTSIKTYEPFRESALRSLFPDRLKLLPGTTQIYELELAYQEAHLLSSEELVRRGAYFRSVDDVPTFHYRICSHSPLQVDSKTSARRRSFFEVNLYKSSYATHGLFPYRGKFHPQMIRAIMNIIGVGPGDVVLDPMVGSGTTCVEASLLGIDSIGVEASPFCTLMGNAKLNGLRIEPGSLRQVAESDDVLLDMFEHTTPQPALFRVNGHHSGIDAAAILGQDPGLASLVKLCYLDAVGYARRRVRKTARDLFRVVLDRYIEAVEQFAIIKEELDLRLGNGQIIEGDARDLRSLGIADASIGGVITSPPYSFAIDYVENDSLQLEYIGADPSRLRTRMIGLHGKDLPERYQNYLQDMRSVLTEAHRVLRPGRFCVVILGTNSNQLRRITGDESPEVALDRQLNGIARDCGYELASDLIHPIEGIGNTMKDEHLLFYKKLE